MTQGVRGWLQTGIRRYADTDLPRLQGDYERVARRPRPRLLLISCADSRLLPDVVIKARPGDVFSIRNIANIVPPFGSVDHSVAAAIEFAVEELRVQAVAVCGHSRCIGLQTLARHEEMALPLRQWLQHADAALWRAPDGKLDEVCRANVLLQLEHVRTYPAVHRRLNQLELIGMYVDVETGRAELLGGVTRA